jgi:hypothetical protein
VTGIETSMASLGGCGSWARSGAGTAAGRVVVQCWRAWKPVFRRVGELAFGAYDHDAKGSTTNQEYYRVRGYSIAVWRVRVPGKVSGSSIGSCMVRGGSLLPRMAVQ